MQSLEKQKPGPAPDGAQAPPPPENPSRHWAGWRSNAGAPTLIVVLVYFRMRLYSAGIADETRDFPLALLRPYSVTGFTPPESPMKRGIPPRITPPDAGAGFFSAGICNAIQIAPFALLRPMRGKAFTPSDSVTTHRKIRSHYSARCGERLLVRRILQWHIGNAARTAAL